MTHERKYSEEEVREIIERASRPPEGSAAGVSPSDGVSLAELQSIGAEIGLSAEQIAHAAATLPTPVSPPRRSLLGTQMSVQHAVDLPRSPTDREWELILVELRTTFRARGRALSHGGLREWVNGNMFAYIEPTESGSRLRLGTLKGDAVAVDGLGVVSLLGGLGTLGVLAVTNDLTVANALVPGVWTLFSGGAFGFNALRLPRWARTREAQMRHVAQRARELIHGTAAPGIPAETDSH